MAHGSNGRVLQTGGNPSPAAEETPPGTRVLFIHPAYPNQFTAIAQELNKRPDFQCYGLVDQRMVPQSGNGVPHFGFSPDGQVDPQTYPFTNAFEAGVRNARGILNAMLGLQAGTRFDAVVGYTGFGSLLGLRPLLDAAIIAYSELPGYHSAAARSSFPFTLDQVLSSQAFEALNYASFLHADLCIVPSKHTKRLFPAELQSKIRVQMEGFDTGDLPQGGPEGRARLGWPVGKPIVGFFGRTLEAVRGFDVFLQVARRLHDLDPDIQFVVIGEEKTIYGNEGQYLNGQSFKQYALAQAGMAEDLVLWYPLMPYEQFRVHIACLDLAILPLFEGAANWNLFEAMAMGLPILASDRCYIPEAIRNGLDGILLDPHDVEGFARQALALLHEPRRARLLGRSAQERVRRRFSVARAAEGYRRIIEEAIARYRASIPSAGRP